jgi:hypothetical protein
MQQQRTDRIGIRVEQNIQVRLRYTFNWLRNSHAKIETNVPICGEYPGLGPTIVLLSATGAASVTPGNIAPAVAPADTFRKVLRLAIGKSSLDRELDLTRLLTAQVYPRRTNRPLFPYPI